VSVRGGLKSQPTVNDELDMTCGQELAQSAEVPEKLGTLMGHVADNMEAHARWVGAASAEARREHDAMLAVAHEYRNISVSSARTAALMRSLRDLPGAPHDPARLDRAALVAWMQAKIHMQREFAALLLAHAEDSERALAGLQGSTPERT
jgi:hypothetical protein